MSIIVWLMAGGLVGWVASQVLQTDGRQGLVLNSVTGIAGAALGGRYLGPLFGVSTDSQADLTLIGLSVSLVGAVILVVVVNLIRRAAVR